jgi:hypothetical protein
MENKLIDNNFMFHESNMRTKPLYETLRMEFKNLAKRVDELCPDSREKSLAMTKLEEAVMWANASIARN